MLFAFVGDGDGAPTVVEVFAGMLVEVERQPRLQACVVTGQVGQFGVIAQGGQPGLGEGFAGDVAFVAARVVVAFVVLVLVFQVLVASGGVLLVVARVGEGVVALYLAGGAYLFGVVKTGQGRFRGIAAGHGLVDHGAMFVRADGTQAADAVGEDESVAVVAVFEGVEQAFLGGEAGDEVEVGFAGLYAVFARLVLEADFAAQVGQFLLGQHVGDDVGHGLALEDAPVGAQVETRQGRFDDGGVAGATKTGVALGEQADQAVHIAHWGFAAPDGEQPRQVEHVIEVDGRVVAGQLQFQLERLGQAFFKREGHHIEGIAFQGLEGESQVALAGHVASPYFD